MQVDVVFEGEDDRVVKRRLRVHVLGWFIGGGPVAREQGSEKVQEPGGQRQPRWSGFFTPNSSYSLTGYGTTFWALWRWISGASRYQEETARRLEKTVQ